MKLIALGLICIFISACASTESVDKGAELTESRRAALISQLNKNKMIWENTNLNRYKYTISIECGLCWASPYNGPNQLIVDDTKIVSLTYVWEPQANVVADNEVSGDAVLNDTIDEIFNWVEKILEVEPESDPLEHDKLNEFLEVEYDVEFGFPAKIVHGHMNVEDGSSLFEVKDFEPL